MEERFTINFVGSTAAQGNKYAESLVNTIRDASPEVVAQRERTREDSLDIGASIAIVLGTTAAGAIAKGIAAWIAKNGGATIEISRNGKVVATNLKSQDAARIAKVFSAKHQE